MIKIIKSSVNAQIKKKFLLVTDVGVDQVVQRWHGSVVVSEWLAGFWFWLEIGDRRFGSGIKDFDFDWLDLDRRLAGLCGFLSWFFILIWIGDRQVIGWILLWILLNRSGWCDWEARWWWWVVDRGREIEIRERSE